MATTVKKITKKVLQWMELSGYDKKLIIDNLTGNPNSFGIEKLTISEAKAEGCDLNFPYRLFNPFNLKVE